MDVHGLIFGAPTLEIDRHSEWEEGIELSYVYWKFAEPHQRAEYRSKTDLGASEALTALMLVRLFSALKNGELRAIGFRVKPDVSVCPVEVPRYCFDQRPNVDDSLNNRLTSSGVQFERVRVVLHADWLGQDEPGRSVGIHQLETVNPASVFDPEVASASTVDQMRQDHPGPLIDSRQLPSIHRTNLPGKTDVPVQSGNALKKDRRKAGRKNEYPTVRKFLKEIELKGLLIGEEKVAELHASFEVWCGRQRTPLGGSVHPCRIRTFRKHLDRYLQECA